MKNSFINDFTDTVKIYYKDIKNQKPLSREMEKELFRKAKEENDMDAKNTILTSNLKFVFDVAKSYKGSGVPMADLISEGNLGLIHAYNKFDYTKDFKFITYAVHWIRWAIGECIKNHISCSEHEINDDEILSTNVRLNQIDDSEDEQINLSDIIMSNESEIIENDNDIERKELIKKLMRNLDKREKEIIEYYFGLNGKKPLNLDECGELLSLSGERVRQIKEKSMLKMKAEALLLS